MAEREYKQLPFYVQKLDADLGVVDAIVAVMGNIDYQKDIIDNGSFTKTINERGNDIQVLDNHNMQSTRDIVGKPIFFREIGRDALPAKVLTDFPEATGGLFASIQFLMDTPEGEGVFKRIKAKAVNKYSIGYDALDTMNDIVKGKDGEDVHVRRLKTIRLWEVSPVIFAANPATTTLGAKDESLRDKAEPEEGKPWGIFDDEGQHCVYKIDEDGNKVGDTLGCHDTRADATSQIRALFAAEEDSSKEDKAVMKTESDGEHPAKHYLVVEDSEKVTTWHLRVYDVDGELDHRLMGAAWAALHGGYRGNVYEGPGKTEAIAKLKKLYAREDMETPDDKAINLAKRIVDLIDFHKEMTEVGAIQRIGDILQGSIHKVFTALADKWYIEGYLDREQRILLSSAIGKALDVLAINIPEDVAKIQVYEYGICDYYGYGMLGNKDELNTKAGRVLAARNASRLSNALLTIIEIFEDAGIDLPGLEKITEEEPEETEEKTDTLGETQAVSKTAPVEQVATETEAGPETPTFDRGKLLKLVDIDLLELELLED